MSKRFATVNWNKCRWRSYWWHLGDASTTYRPKRSASAARRTAATSGSSGSRLRLRGGTLVSRQRRLSWRRSAWVRVPFLTGRVEERPVGRSVERQFQVDGDVVRNRSMDRWIGEWCSYNLAAGSFHTKTRCSRLFSREVKFYWHKQRYRVFVPPFGGLRGNVHGSSMARCKARGRLAISANWTFFR